MDAEITEAQISMIIRLLDQKRISMRLASKIIQALVDLPDLNDDGLKTPNLKPDK